MTETLLRVDVEGRVGTVVLNDPDRLNALGRGMLEGLIEAAHELSRHRDVAVVVIKGAGRVFTAGADIGVFAPGHEMTLPEADAGRRMADAIESIEAVTIAQIHGHCIGGGLVLAAACDLRVAATATVFAIPEVDLGIPLAWGGIPRLVREIGPALTKELVMTCRSFSAEEALAAGFLNRVVAAADLEGTVEELTTELLAKPLGPLLATKRHVNDVSRKMAGIDRDWADAAALYSARRDPANQAAATAYLAALKAARSSDG